ncbi:related to molybdenum cofactor sulfurase HxB protein [Cephalotrichum gorgonifer]|uniref:Molybdenum cofactor sulfurase n=1 Tax=Cephalotrichum gorgonifer TaxID=2041049 RepID=A0AAE8MPM7_9PEZI|nr:related to molybdenum cofactor sulfurase HxB protein [Cephalotrichum gorgonifer]
MTNLLGNPHSLSLSSQLSSSRVEDARLRLLTFLGADPSEFDLVFVANATAAIKLVTEAFRAAPDGFSYAYHQSAHTSLVGIREEAKASYCLSDSMVEAWIQGVTPFVSDQGIDTRPLLFSYTAQSHMNGQRYPLSWTSRLRESAQRSGSSEPYVLLDAASYAATSPLDLSGMESPPDFVALSLYKIFGFPDLGALLVRRSAEPIFQNRRYFGGGTVDMVICEEDPCHVRKQQFLHDQLEDGTLPVHSILALDSALNVYHQQFGSMSRVSSHTSYLRDILYAGLSSLRHYNGRPVCVMYSKARISEDPLGVGPVVAFNLQSSMGEWISTAELEKLAGLKKIHIRTGGVCCPGGVASALDLTPKDIRRNFASGVRCGSLHDLVAGRPTGVIRASLGAMSIKSDVDRFIQFISEFYQEGTPTSPTTFHPTATEQPTQLEVKSVIVYPIKSCGGFHIPVGSRWRVKREGLAWDREWCLVHQGSGQALGQKRYPKMALIKPEIDFPNDVLRISYRGGEHPDVPAEITIPLSVNPNLDDDSLFRDMASRVCGDAITAQTYTSPETTNFFSSILGVPCFLARFPAGGRGRSRRSAKPPTPKISAPRGGSSLEIPGSFPDHPPTPPESDSEHSAPLLLANESPILLVHTPSVDYLNESLSPSTSQRVPPTQFRPNLVVGPVDGSEALPAYSEESWQGLTVGSSDTGVFRVMGKCFRCQMVCVDQDTGVRGEEPFVTLARTRRVDGKVPFGVHVCLESEEATTPWVSVGDPVFVR